jgi:hypothetical protein
MACNATVREQQRRAKACSGQLEKDRSVCRSARPWFDCWVKRDIMVRRAGNPPRAHDDEESTMRVMVLIKADKNTETGALPDEKLLAAMGRYNEELVQAGVMLAGEGLQASAQGARVRFSGATRTIIDGPFPTREVIAGFWLWRVESLDDAIEWVKRCPNPLDGDAEIEIRPVFEAEDFGDVLTPELRAQEERLRARLEVGRSAGER